MYRLLASGTMLGLCLQVVPITCLVGIVYAVIRYRHIKKRGCAVVWGTEIIVPVAIAIPVVIELIQSVIGRSFDMDDVLTNFMGIIAGYLVAAALKEVLKSGIRGTESPTRYCRDSKGSVEFDAPAGKASIGCQEKSRAVEFQQEVMKWTLKSLALL